MKLMMYAVYDRAAMAFLPPFFTNNEGLAVRGFADATNNPETQFFRHPQDFSLNELGNFDDNSGVFELLHEPKRVCTAMDVKIKPNINTELFDEISDDSQLSGHSEG